MARGPAPLPLAAGLDTLLPELRALYEDLHAHPELSGQETRTAGLVADGLRAGGWEVTERVGGNGVVGVLRGGAGEGPVILLRADMDGLPVLEDTGLPYASAATGTDRDGGAVPVMHACGHDMHVTCLMGAAALLARHRAGWAGTVVAVFQPAEESGDGAAGMLADGFADRFPRPEVCLGQHVAPFPFGMAATRPGAVMAASDTLVVRLFGRGGHGSTPESTVDPVVMAASVVLRLQTIVSREVGAHDAAVVTVGSLHSGSRENIIPDEAELRISVRTTDPVVRDVVLAAIERIVRAEAAASGAPREPAITTTGSFPLLVNDADGAARVTTALAGALGEGQVLTLPRPVTASEDFGRFGDAYQIPSVFWYFGGVDPVVFATEAADAPGAGDIPPGIPRNHSPRFAPVPDETITAGVRAMLAAAASWLVADGGTD
ncbi:amidohydrolase [Streptomyces sp. DW26H14]|uniref:amidohydrolase n=1 Tax=Streptomyces sp. DW26H14 TaxID=3435395 RepID=UPI00403DB554